VDAMKYIVGLGAKYDVVNLVSVSNWCALFWLVHFAVLFFSLCCIFIRMAKRPFIMPPSSERLML
jgi:hypothetical protein